MTTTLGLAVSADAIRAVALRDGAVLWASEATRDDAPLAAQLGRFLATLPRRRWPRARVSVAVGPSASQVKRIAGLPPLTDRDSLAALVREGAGRFFLRNGIPLVTTGVRPIEPGAVWSAAIDEPVVNDITRACDSAGLRLVSIVPSVVVLGRALENRRVVWTDGDACSVAEFEGGSLIRTTRRAGDDDGSESLPEAVRALASLGPDAWRYAAAYGAAMQPADEPVSVRRATGARGTPIATWRLAVAGAACAIAIAAALAAPYFAARRVEHQATTRIAAVARARADALNGERSLATVTGALGEVAAFEATRRSATLLLASITRALPEGSAITALRTDSASASLVVLAPQGAAVLARLEKAQGVFAPEITGPLTREVVGAAQLERVTIRFRLTPLIVGGR